MVAAIACGSAVCDCVCLVCASRGGSEEVGQVAQVGGLAGNCR